MPPAGDGWEPALAAALLGAERAPPAIPDTLANLAAGADPGGALLVRLAVHATLHRAGSGLGPEALTPAEPRPRIGPECPPAAAARLHDLLTGGLAARARLEEWCALAAARGLRAPDWLLPALAARRDTLRDAIDGIAGPELAWLAHACGDAPEAADAPADWTDGTTPERRAAFTAWRARDPEAARAALEPVFRNEKADLREALVGALATSLSQADEPFLEACLDDRSGGVRMAAGRLLPRLPASRHAARMGERVRAALAIEGRSRLPRGPAHSLVVTLPEASADLARDGVEAGARSALLRAVLAAAPLHAFADHPPRLWIGLALASEWADSVLTGLHAMVRRTRDPAWTVALADGLSEACIGTHEEGPRADALRDLRARVFGLLPEADWEARVADRLRAGDSAGVPALLAHGPLHFSEAFSAVLLDWLAFVSRSSDAARQSLGEAAILGSLGERLWPGAEAAARAAALPARMPDAEGGPLHRHLAVLAETLNLRAAMRRDFESVTGGEGALG